MVQAHTEILGNSEEAIRENGATEIVEGGEQTH